MAARAGGSHALEQDFGHYLLRCPGAFFGIGAGEQHAPLHTADYEYPDSLLAPTAEAFLALMEGAHKDALDNEIFRSQPPDKIKFRPRPFGRGAF